MTEDDDEKTLEMPEHVALHIHEMAVEHQRTIETFEREVVLDDYEDEEVFEKVVSIRDERERRDVLLPPPYTPLALELIRQFYLDRIEWLETWCQEEKR
jgi:hypothetical protein